MRRWRGGWCRALSCLLAGVLTASAHAITLDVDARGGPADLIERVDEAVAAWRDAGLDVDAIVRSVRVRYGDRSLLGPDVRVLVATVDDVDVDLEVLVHPDLLETAPGALVYALGVAFGGESGEGALDARRAAGAEGVAPTAEDVAAISAAALADPADLNRDGVVDFEDLLLLSERFGERGINLPGDLDGDGVVDETDLELLRARYTFSPLGRTPPVEGEGEADPEPGELPEVPAPLPGPPDAPDPDAPDPVEPAPVEPAPMEPTPETPAPPDVPDDADPAL